ncbi:hypothetical protein ACHHYP_04863 [Achlya hypogyna]|uniref:HSF-type DNA-binding domain-containing protein n=1 Tax=Achlya hypogyna TaxID=1202772 RepID=A0A1V9YZQ6_ACHHY|nr:hypothetical protein ACHHYP_04863 [Achlya hypogyna]
MTSKKTRSTGIPKFLRHLYSILTKEDPSIISWAADGASIQLHSVKRLENEILPKYFKHNKLASFQRQLNYFGFRKWTKTQSSICTFSHPEFTCSTTPETLSISRKKETVAALPPIDVLDDLFIGLEPENGATDPLGPADWEVCVDLLSEDGPDDMAWLATLEPLDYFVTV